MRLAKYRLVKIDRKWYGADYVVSAEAYNDHTETAIAESSDREELLRLCHLMGLQPANEFSDDVYFIYP